MFLKGEWLLKGDGSLKEMGPEFSPQSPGLRKAQSRSVSMGEAEKDLGAHWSTNLTSCASSKPIRNSVSNQQCGAAPHADL